MAIKLQHKKTKQKLQRKPQMYTKLNLVKLKRGLGVFYAIRSGNGSEILRNSQYTHTQSLADL